MGVVGRSSISLPPDCTRELQQLLYPLVLFPTLPMTDGGEILVLGPENAGKSMLLRRLKGAVTGGNGSTMLFS